jgi:hypothetical protein
MTQLVRIFRPAKTAMQSGRGKTHEWIMEFETNAPNRVEPLMGWVSGADTRNQVRLRFDSREEAIAYADARGLRTVIQDPQERTVKPKSYADNFRPERIRR